MAVPQGGVHPITIYEGAGFSEEFELFEEDEVTPLPFAVGTTGVAKIRAGNDRDAALIATCTVEVDDNVVTLTLAAEDTVGLKYNTGYYDILLTEPGEEAQMFIEGSVRIDPTVSS